MKKMLPIFLITLSLLGCTTLRSGRARELYICEGYEGLIDRAMLTLDSLAVERGFESPALEANAEYIINVLLARRNGQLAKSAAVFRMRVVIKEESFTRGFDKLNTVAIEISIFQPSNGGAIALALYSESTENTIQSYTYLHSLIRRACKPLLF